MTEVWLIRHGQTAYSITGQHSGRYDLPLTEDGEREAEAVGAMLKGRAFDFVFCSPLQRALRTCEIAGYLRIATVDPDLQEWDYGDCTGFTMEQIRERMPGWTVWKGPVPDGESLVQVGARARRAVDRIRALGGTVAVFAHGHFLRVFATQWLGIPPENGRHFALETCAVSVLGEDAGYPAVRAWNLRNGI